MIDFGPSHPEQPWLAEPIVVEQSQEVFLPLLKVPSGPAVPPPDDQAVASQEVFLPLLRVLGFSNNRLAILLGEAYRLRLMKTPDQFGQDARVGDLRRNHLIATMTLSVRCRESRMILPTAVRRGVAGGSHPPRKNGEPPDEHAEKEQERATAWQHHNLLGTAERHRSAAGRPSVVGESSRTCCAPPVCCRGW